MNRLKATDLFEQLSPGYRLDQKLGPVFDRPPAGADDLTEIRGVDTREAVILNRLGVYQWAQLALWTDREASRFADELGMSLSTLAEEAWIEQARTLCRPTLKAAVTNRHPGILPASLIRTLSLLSCAMLIGCLVVYWLSLRSDQPLRGVLSAEITSVRVPASSKLLEAFVQPGDEVFTGDRLLTLEKTEHTSIVSLQQQRVQELERELHRAEAQASLDLEWRLREVEREISEVRTRAHLIQEVKRDAEQSLRSASAVTGPADSPDSNATTSVPETSVTDTSTGDSTAQPVSQSRVYEQTSVPRTNNLVFYGASGETNHGVPRPTSEPVLPQSEPAPAFSLTVPTTKPVVVTKPVVATIAPLRLASEPSSDAMLTAEAINVRLRLERLEDLKETLPDQVRRAAGVDSLRALFDEAVKYLSEIRTISREVAVVCPGYGRVGQVRFQPGDHMEAGDVLLKILHTDRRYVMLNVPTRRMHEIQPGNSVDLIFPGNQRFCGQVTNLPMLAEASANGQSLATVRVEPTGRLWPEIPIGSQIDVLLK
ncbi:MAG: HlyD family efflux transporter periplasmic adaptor subunit [Planctomycetaceae bacterium]